MIIDNDFATTFFFKDIIPDLSTFKEFVEQFTTLDAQDTLHAFLFKYLFARFNNSNVAYDTPADFLMEFGISYQNGFNQYKKRKEAIDKIYGLTTDELTVVNEIIQAWAETPATATNNPLDGMTDYINRQQGQKQTQNKLTAYQNALKDMNDEYIDNFLRRFKKHFIHMFSNDMYMYEN